MAKSKATAQVTTAELSQMAATILAGLVAPQTVPELQALHPSVRAERVAYLAQLSIEMAKAVVAEGT
jgi:hypothetical protein